MKTKVFGTVLWCLVLIVGMTGAVWSAPGPTATPPSVGDGSSGNPYQIVTLNNLYWISQNSAEWSKHYIQTVDIDASTTSGWDSGSGWTPIGNSTTKFTGSYDGDGHTISGLFIDRSAWSQGLFGEIDHATIQDLGVTVVDITNGSYNTGGLVGYNISSSIISNCYSTGSVISTASRVGGLVGHSEDGTNSSIINMCYSTCTVSGLGSVGGLVGYGRGFNISNCYASGSVTGQENYTTGGLVGNNSTIMENCYSTGVVTGLNASGLIGQNPGIVTNSFWDTETSTRSYSTAGTGKTTAEMKEYATFFSEGGWDFMIETVNGSDHYWGLNPSQNNGYPFLSIQGFTHDPDYEIITLAPSNISFSSVTFNGSAGDLSISQHGFCWNSTGTPTVSDSKTELGALSSTGEYLSNISGLDPNTTYYVRAYSIISGFTNYGFQEKSFKTSLWSGYGTEAGPYQIANKSDLKNVVDNSEWWTKYFILTDAITFSSADFETGGDFYDSGAYWTPIGNTTTKFTGGFDGGGYIITGLKINRPSSDKIGLFGYTNGATLANVKLESISITGNDMLGGLVGWNNASTISNSYVTGTITGANAGWAVGGLVGYNVASNISGSHASGTVTGTGVWEIGGLLGYNESSSVITNCYAVVTVNGEGEVGGLSGISDDCTYTGCYATGNVSGTDGYVGGLIGDNYGGSSFSNCYATGDAVSTGGGYIGGFAGELISDEVSNCYATGNATDNSVDDQSYTGGFAGYSSNSTISHTTAGGNVSGNYYVGGLIGKNFQTSIDYSSASGAVTGTADLVGGLIGENDKGTIQYCYANGNVTGTGESYIGSSGGPESYEIGGLIGANSSGTISNSYATGDVNGYSSIGGLAGRNQTKYISPTPIIAEISNCYSVGSVTGTTNTGGLAGNNTGTIAHCRWDTEISGKTTGIAISSGTYESSTDNVGKTTAEMKTEDITSWSWSTSIWQRVGYNYPSLIENFDQSLPVELASFTAKITDKGDVLLQWITESEIENQGFNLYRGTSEHGDYQKINNVLIPGAGSSPDRHTYNYADKNPGNAQFLWYQLEDVDFTGKCTRHEPVSPAMIAKVMPKEFCLYPNYPNPFNPVTQFTYEIPEARAVHIAIYGITGAKVCDLFDATQEPGTYILRWDGTDTQGTVLPSGIYFVVIRAGRDYDTFKMTLLR